MSGTKRATFAPTICVDGCFLVPMLIFKGTRKGRIVKKEFPTFAPVCLYACEENALMDEECRITWMDKILIRYVALHL